MASTHASSAGRKPRSELPLKRSDDSAISTRRCGTSSESRPVRPLLERLRVVMRPEVGATVTPNHAVADDDDGECGAAAEDQPSCFLQALAPPVARKMATSASISAASRGGPGGGAEAEVDDDANAEKPRVKLPLVPLVDEVQLRFIEGSRRCRSRS